MPRPDTLNPAFTRMPLPEQYSRQLMETTDTAERESRWDGWLALARVIGEITL